MAPTLVGKEVVEAYAEHERNAKQGRQRRVELVSFELGKQRRRQPGVFAQLDQSEALLQSKGAQFGTNLVGTKIIVNRFADHGGASFSFQSKTRLNRIVSSHLLPNASCFA